MVNQFSFMEYRQILDAYRDRFVDYELALRSEEFVVLRHDVEFSTARAHKVAQIEYEHNVASNYFFQVMCNAYNIFSDSNLIKINETKEMGHKIGLHFYVSHLNAPSRAEIEEELARQVRLFETSIRLRCCQFSFHRPPKWALSIRQNRIKNLINAYGPAFFEYSNVPQRIKYIADSKHRWTYGHPLEHQDHRKIQILLHPDEWTEEGDCGLDGFFKEIGLEHLEQFKVTLDEETSYYRETRGN